MPTLYHLSSENFDFFSPNKTGKNFGESNFYREQGAFFAPNMRSALEWADALSIKRDQKFQKLYNKYIKEEKNIKQPKTPPINQYKFLYLYTIVVNRNDLERWKNIKSIKDKNIPKDYIYYAPEIFIPARDFNKINIVSKKKYLTSELNNKYNIEQLRPKSKGYEEHLLQDLYGEEEAEKIKEKEKQEEELKPPEFFDDLLKQDKEKRKQKKIEEEIKERFSFTNNINWYKIAKNINGES